MPETSLSGRRTRMARNVRKLTVLPIAGINSISLRVHEWMRKKRIIYEEKSSSEKIAK